MTPTIPGSLWPSDIKADIQSPFTILDLQAKALSRQTNGVLVGDVQTSFDKEKGLVYLGFDIVVPALEGLRRRLLTASYRADMIYPAKVDAARFPPKTEESGALFGAALGQLAAMYATPLVGRPGVDAASDDEFRALIAKVLRSDEVKSLAVSLIARANDVQRDQASRSSAENQTDSPKLPKDSSTPTTDS